MKSRSADDFKLTLGVFVLTSLFIWMTHLLQMLNLQYRQPFHLIEAAGYDLKGAQAGILPKTSLMWSPTSWVQL